MTTYDIPKKFWKDHLSRGLRCSEDCLSQDTHTEDEGQMFSRFYRVDLTDIDAAELLSDARYYSTEWRYMGEGLDYAGLGSSAAATVRRLEETRR